MTLEQISKLALEIAERMQKETKEDIIMVLGITKILLLGEKSKSPSNRMPPPRPETNKPAPSRSASIFGSD